MGISALLSTQILDSTSIGRSILKGANAASIRTILGLGSTDVPVFNGTVYRAVETGPYTEFVANTAGSFFIFNDYSGMSFAFNMPLGRTEIDCPNKTFIAGDVNGNGSGTSITIDDVHNSVDVSGSLTVSGGLRAYAIFNTGLFYTNVLSPFSSNTTECQGNFAIRNGVNPRRLEVYGSYTDASNYRRLYLTQTTGGAATIGVEGLGTGATGNTLSLLGNASTATKLATPRNINGVPFDGSADITISGGVSRFQVLALGW